ncbi:uncharacterized protein LOC117123156 [Anneissia japonica]|uniref:uncharacterized protein LOC117123156 n=1 Tax=Anneissia japonica TaxID=1529436 RepID=UPI001425B481|nr:uncharacterized protein LOC117123156 [Anneissia japonica]
MTSHHIHVFCDSSERAYGAVAYLRGESDGGIRTNFVMARSKVAPKKELSMPRLELCAALVGAKLLEFIKNELTLTITEMHLWSDSKMAVFRKLSLQGPKENWPQIPDLSDSADCSPEIRKTAFCGIVDVAEQSKINDCRTYDELMTYLSTRLDGAAPHMLEREGWVIIQRESFAEELSALKSGKNVDRTSRINQLDPIIDEDTGLMCVGGRLNNAQLLQEQKTPVILEPKHPIIKLIIKKTDENLHHPGTERLLAELRRRVWILRGREVIRGIQRQC